MDSTLKHTAAFWVEEQADLRGWSKSYVRTLQVALDNHICPVVGHKPVAELTRADVVSVTSRVRDRLAPSTAQKTLGIFRRLCEGLEDVPRSVVDAASNMHVPTPRRQGQTSSFVTPDKRPPTSAVWDVAGEMERPAYQLAVLLAAFCGLRISEVSGLERKHVDLDDGLLHIKQSITYPGGKFVVGLPKHEKVRTVPVPGLIRDWVEHQVAEADGPETPMCPSPTGLPLRPRNFYTYSFGPARRTAGWAQEDDGSWQWSFHSLRHHYADWLLDADVDVRDVAALMGHSSPSTTWDTYVSSSAGVFDRVRGAWGEAA